MHPNRKALNEEIATCRKKGFHVHFVPDKKTADYIGMNDVVGKKLGFPIKKKTLEVDRNLTLKEKRAVLAHERIERELMAKGWPYWKAHKFALKNEGK